MGTVFSLVLIGTFLSYFSAVARRSFDIRKTRWMWI